MKPVNIFSDIPQHLPNEIFQTIINTSSCKIERIISKSHSSPKDFWYNQDQNEWVIILKGQAQIEFEKDKKVVKMKTGDYINLPAHCKHRVKWTHPEKETIWLAVFYD